MGLFSKCLHDWVVIAKTFMPPVPEREDSFLDDPEYCERARAGVTTVLMVCDQCGNKNVTEMLGKEIAP